MKKIVLAAVLVAATSTPALAQVAAGEFTGPRVGVEIGVTDDDFLGTDEASFGINAGYDFDLGGAVVGGTVGYSRAFDDNDVSELSVTARVGAKVSPRGLLYVNGGYSTLKLDVPGTSIDASIDGIRVGAGAEFAATDKVFVNLETRYGNYEAGVELYQTVIGVGFRF